MGMGRKVNLVLQGLDGPSIAQRDDFDEGFGAPVVLASQAGKLVCPPCDQAGLVEAEVRNLRNFSCHCSRNHNYRCRPQVALYEFQEHLNALWRKFTACPRNIRQIPHHSITPVFNLCAWCSVHVNDIIWSDCKFKHNGFTYDKLV